MKLETADTGAQVCHRRGNAELPSLCTGENVNLPKTSTEVSVRSDAVFRDQRGAPSAPSAPSPDCLA